MFFGWNLLFLDDFYDFWRKILSYSLHVFLKITAELGLFQGELNFF